MYGEAKKFLHTKLIYNINSKTAPTAVTLSECPEHELNHGYSNAVLILIHPYKTLPQYPIPLHLLPQSWHCYNRDVSHDPRPSDKTLPPCLLINLFG